jgi:hypothetical protein
MNSVRGSEAGEPVDLAEVNRIVRDLEELRYKPTAILSLPTLVHTYDRGYRD